MLIEEEGSFFEPAGAGVSAPPRRVLTVSLDRVRKLVSDITLARDSDFFGAFEGLNELRIQLRDKVQKHLNPAKDYDSKAKSQLTPEDERFLRFEFPRLIQDIEQTIEATLNKKIHSHPAGAYTRKLEDVLTRTKNYFFRLSQYVEELQSELALSPDALELKYQLRQPIYSLFYHASDNGELPRLGVKCINIEHARAILDLAEKICHQGHFEFQSSIVIDNSRHSTDPDVPKLYITTNDPQIHAMFDTIMSQNLTRSGLAH